MKSNPEPMPSSLRINTHPYVNTGPIWIQSPDLPQSLFHYSQYGGLLGQAFLKVVRWKSKILHRKNDLRGFRARRISCS